MEHDFNIIDSRYDFVFNTMFYWECKYCNQIIKSPNNILPCVLKLYFIIPCDEYIIKSIIE